MKDEPSGDHLFARSLAVCSLCQDQLEDGAIDAVVARVRESAGFESRNASRRRRRSLVAFLDASHGSPEAV